MQNIVIMLNTFQYNLEIFPCLLWGVVSSIFHNILGFYKPNNYTIVKVIFWLIHKENSGWLLSYIVWILTLIWTDHSFLFDSLFVTRSQIPAAKSILKLLIRTEIQTTSTSTAAQNKVKIQIIIYLRKVFCYMWYIQKW